METKPAKATNVAEQPLVQVVKNEIVTTSLQVAKYFGKEHKNVLQDIRNLECTPKFIELNFKLYHYHSKLNENVTRKLPMYYITRDGFTFLAMGFTGKVAAKFKEDYINAFNEMEKSLLEIREKGLVSVKLLKDQKSLTDYWKHEAEFYCKSFNRTLDIMNITSSNQLNLSKLYTETRDKLKVEKDKNDQISKIINR